MPLFKIPKKLHPGPKKIVFISSLFLFSLVIVYIDVKTGYAPDLTIAYLIPTIAAIVLLNLTWGFIVACFATAAEILADHAFGFISESDNVINTLLHLAVILIVAVLIDRLLEALRHVTELQKKRDRDLLIAQNLQRRIFNPFQEKIGSLSMGGRVSFASELGGDYYYFSERDDRLFLCVGDISGKGVASALFSNLLHHSVTESLRGAGGLREIVSEINTRMAASLPDDMFVTLFACELHSDSIEFINAGHEPPLIYRADSHTVEYLEHRSVPPIGVLDDLPAEVHREPFRDGDRLFCYTDGISESPKFISDPVSAMTELILNHAGESPQQVADLIFSSASGNGGEPQRDDILIICVRKDPS